jgi:hypothetical protein
MSPSLFREKGYRFYFLSRAAYHKLNAKKLGEIQSIIEEHKDEIIQEWRKHFSKR